jgi:uncharacterized protein (TIGR02001 family)
MNMIKTALMAAVATAGLAGAAHAGDLSFNAGVASDYIFRGIDQTADHEGEIFGGVDYAAGEYYAGVWASSTGPDDDQAVEYDLYGGWKPKLGGATLDLGAIFYGYTNSDLLSVNSSFNTLELKAGVSYPVGPATVGATAYYAPKNGGFGDEHTWYFEGNAAYTFGDGGPTVSGAVGQFQIDNFAPVDSYTTWNAGVTFPIRKFSVDLRYYGTNDDADSLFGSNIAGDAFVVSGKIVLP